MTPPLPPRTVTGFTLVEALVALAILGVAAAGLIRAVEAHIDTTAQLEARTIAQWVAENEIVERTVLANAVPQEARRVEMLGRSWSVRVSSRSSDDPELAAMRVSVSAADVHEPMLSMDFFVEAGAVTR